MTRPRQRWVLFMQYVGPFLLVIAVAVGGSWKYTQDQCFERRDNVARLREVVTAATEPQSGGTPLDLTKAEGFDQLDPATQTWARSVQQMISARPADAPSVRDTLLAVIPPIEC